MRGWCFEAGRPRSDAGPTSRDQRLRGPGLREGEALVSIESAFLFPDKEPVVTVHRHQHPVAVRYLPAGPQRDGFAWIRVSGIPPSAAGGDGSLTR